MKLIVSTWSTVSMLPESTARAHQDILVVLHLEETCCTQNNITSIHGNEL